MKLKPEFLAIVLLASMACAGAQTITRTVTSDGRVVYSDRPQTGTAVEQRTLSGSQLAATNVLNGKGEDSSLRACQADLAHYCASHSGSKEGMECLLDHQQDVTDACYAAMKQRMQNQQNQQNQSAASDGADAQDGADAKGGPAADAAAPPRGPMQACQPDVKKLCQGVQPGGGRLVKCLLDKQSALSDACYDALSDMKNKRQGQDAGARSAPAR